MSGSTVGRLMKFPTFVRAAFLAMLLVGFSSAAAAQAPGPGAELIGQPVQVTTNGVTNTVFLEPAGAARIVTAGGRTINGSWTASNGHLCLVNGAAQECWPYSAPFQAGQPVTLTSSCNATSTWLASAVNTPAPSALGERGQ